ncbi:hypothetical protein D1007_61298 [Hordeum vulgare]|nr:hypothetical protein D1007_61298 [Hordeum vulgare]
MGGHFYDFYYEVDQVPLRGPNGDDSINNTVMSKDKKKQDENTEEVNKKPKFDGVSGGLEEKMPSATQAEGKQDQMQESHESLESDASLHTSLLIDSMTMDYMEEVKHVSPVVLISKPEKIMTPINGKISFVDVVRSCPQGMGKGAPLEELETGNASYRVESPELSLGTEVIPTPLATRENLRFSLRNVHSKMENVQEKVVVAAKKRDIEGDTRMINSFDAFSNPEMILAAIKMGSIYVMLILLILM